LFSGLGDVTLSRIVIEQHINLKENLMKKISIIGAGIGGLTSGIYLQNNGYQVTIHEKNSHPGGKMDYSMSCFLSMS